jgi:hypothetical protein
MDCQTKGINNEVPYPGPQKYKVWCQTSSLNMGPILIDLLQIHIIKSFVSSD